MIRIEGSDLNVIRIPFLKSRRVPHGSFRSSDRKHSARSGSPGCQVIPETAELARAHFREQLLVVLFRFLRADCLHFDEKGLHEFEGDFTIVKHALVSWRSKGEIDDMCLLLDLLEAHRLEQTTQERSNAEISPTRSGSETGFACGVEGNGIPLLESLTVGRAWLIEFREPDQATWT